MSHGTTHQVVQPFVFFEQSQTAIWLWRNLKFSPPGYGIRQVARLHLQIFKRACFFPPSLPLSLSFPRLLLPSSPPFFLLSFVVNVQVTRRQAKGNPHLKQRAEAKQTQNIYATILKKRKVDIILTIQKEMICENDSLF